MTAKKQGDSSVPHIDSAQLEHLLEQRHTIAQELHDSTSKAQAERALAEVTSTDEAVQMALYNLAGAKIYPSWTPEPAPGPVSGS